MARQYSLLLPVGMAAIIFKTVLDIIWVHPIFYHFILLKHAKQKVSVELIGVYSGGGGRMSSRLYTRKLRWYPILSIFDAKAFLNFSNCKYLLNHQRVQLERRL